MDKRVDISRIYLTGWFTIDVFAVVPFNLMFSMSDLSSAARLTKFGKLGKLIKMMRLMKLMKIFKEQGKISGYFSSIFRFTQAFERLAMFILSFFLVTHIVTCLWIILSGLAETPESWISTFGY